MMDYAERHYEEYDFYNDYDMQEEIDKLEPSEPNSFDEEIPF